LLRLHSFIGFLVLALLAWLFSEKRRDVRIRILLTGLGLQICLALLLLKLPGAQQAFLWLNNAVQALEESTRAGTVMVLYAAILSKVIPGVIGHLLIASIISAPAAVTIAKLMIPETGDPSAGEVEIPSEAHSSMDAITRGTLGGVRLLINIIAMLVVFVGLVHLLNLLLGILPDFFGRPITFQRLMGYVMAPVTWVMGIPWSEALITGELMGTKTVLNELLAYLKLASLPEGTLSERSRLIIIYAMCGFANFGSLGIMIGGLGAMAKERRDEIVGLGIKSIVAGTIATCMTGALVGMIY